MAQRITQLQRIFYGVESTEGTEVLGTATEAFLIAGAPTFGEDFTVHQRKFRGQMGFYTGKPGHYPAPSLSFQCELRNRGATNNVPEIDELLKTVFGTRTLDSGSATSTVSSTTTVLDVDDTSNFTAGNAVAVETATANEYEIGWIQSVDSGTQMTLEQALSFTPANGAKVRPSLTFKPADSGHQSLSFQVWLDSTDYKSFLGCKGSARIEVAEAGAIPMITFDWQALGWKHTTSGSRPAQTFGDTGLPPIALAARFALDGTATGVRSFSVDLAQDIGRKMSHNSTYGTAAELVTDRNPVWNASIYNSDQTEYTGWLAGTEREVTHQFGVALNNMVGMRIPKAQAQTVAFGEDSGLATDEVSGQCGITSGADEFYLAFL